MTASTLLPPPVLSIIMSTLGELSSVKRLGGMSSGGVYCVRCARQSAIAKCTSGVAEAHFYQTVVPTCPELQPFTPALLATVLDDERIWLLLEAIPHPLPLERRLADPDLLGVLRILHQSSLPALHEALDPYRPDWGTTTNERALAAISSAKAESLAGLLDAMRQEAQPLFDPRCPISGDPNPANWGLRDDNSIALFDWERFCWGTPALDLAITVPGLGNMAGYRQVAAVYSADNAHVPQDQLVREIALAKVWSVVEFLANNAGRGTRTDATVAWIAQHFTGWARQLARDLALR